MTNPSDPVSSVNVGLTKREYFAAMAMQGILANAKFMEALGELAGPDDKKAAAGVSAFSVTVSSALITELNKPLPEIVTSEAKL